MLDRIKMLKELTQVDGVAANEKEVSRLFKSYVEDICDEITYDNLGSIVCRKTSSSKSPKIMLAAHMDEVGFLVKSIEDSGYIRLHPVGGWWTHVLLSQLMTVTTRDEKKYVGIIGSSPPHGMPAETRNKVLDIKNIYLDIGVKDKQEVLDLGIKQGDMVTPKGEFRVMNNPNYLLAKAWDNRVAVGVVIEVLHRLKDETHPNSIFACGTVQEEVGLRGAQTCAYYVKPDIALTIDVTLSNDLPDGKGDVKLGSGVALSLGDSSIFTHKGLFEYVENIASEIKIPFVYDILAGGGTDSGTIHKSMDGIPTMTLSIPSRYIHSNLSMIHQDDYTHTIDLITELCKRFDKSALNLIYKSIR